jgi:hypothetical protein
VVITCNLIEHVCFWGSYYDCGFKKINLKKVWLAVIGWIRYVFSKNYGWSLCVAKNMYTIFGESIVTIAFQSVF